MNRIHGAAVDAAQTPIFLSMFERSNSAQTGTCSLCLREARNLKAHVAHHLEQIALFALPRENELPAMDSGANVGGSIHASKNRDSDISETEEFRSPVEEPFSEGAENDTTSDRSDNEIFDRVAEAVIPEQDPSIESSWAEVYLKTKPSATNEDRSQLETFMKVPQHLHNRRNEISRWLNAPDPS